MMAEIGAGLASLKGAMDIAKGLNSLENTVALNEAKIALQEKIIDAQSILIAAQEAQNSNISMIEELRKKLADIDAWKQEKERYRLVQSSTGVFTYDLKDNDPSGEPFHRICVNCVNAGHKSILQTTIQSRGGLHAHCPRCNSKLQIMPNAPLRIENGDSHYF